MFKFIYLSQLNTNIPKFIYDENGKIIGYKSKDGADTVFPFNSDTEGYKLLATYNLNTSNNLDLSKYDFVDLSDSQLVSKIIILQSLDSISRSVYGKDGYGSRDESWNLWLQHHVTYTKSISGSSLTTGCNVYDRASSYAAASDRNTGYQYFSGRYYVFYHYIP